MASGTMYSGLRTWALGPESRPELGRIAERLPPESSLASLIRLCSNSYHVAFVTLDVFAYGWLHWYIRKFIKEYCNKFSGVNHTLVELLLDTEVAMACWDNYKRANNISEDTCGRGEYSLLARESK